MANLKISQLTALTTIASGDLFEIVDISDTSMAASGTNKKITRKVALNPLVTSVTSSATPTPNADTDEQYQLTALAASATFAAPSGTPVNGQKMVIRIKDNGTGRTLAFNAIYRAIGVTLPTTTTANKTIYLGMIYNSADTKWDVLAVGTES